MNRPINKIISILLTTAMFNLCWMTSFGWAEIAAIDSAVAVSIQNSADREKIRALLNREDVQQQLEAYGISHEEALTRVNSLTAGEVEEIMGKLDQLPGAGESSGYIFWEVLASIIFAPVALVLDSFYCFAIMPVKHPGRKCWGLTRFLFSWTNET